MLKHLPRCDIEFLLHIFNLWCTLVNCTLDQTLCLFLLISEGFNKFKPGFRAILTAIDFFKAFYFVWHPTLFHKLNFGWLPPCCDGCTQSFYCNRRAYVVFQNHKSRFFRVRRDLPQESVLGRVPFSPHQ